MSIAWQGGTKIYLAPGATDMRKGFDGLSALVCEALKQDPFSEHLYVFRSRRGDRLKALYWDGTGLCLYAKRLERGSFVWPRPEHGVVRLTAAQLSMLVEGLDWRRVVVGEEVFRPTAV